MFRADESIAPEEANMLMGRVLEHYVKHHDVVLRKLIHARGATKQSIDEIDSLSASADLDKPAYNIKEMEAYDLMWKSIIDLFRNAGIDEKELVKIETTLTKIPHLIKKYYTALVDHDKILQELMKELRSEEYQTALRLTKEIQLKPDQMSGLSPQEFENTECERSFLFQIPFIKNASV